MNMTEQELFDVPVPSATSTYTPVPHRTIVENVNNVLQTYNIGIAKREYKTNREGTQAVGLLDLDKSTKTFGYRLVFRNSYDKSMAVAFSASVQVLACSNGMMVGNQIHGFRRKHTGRVDVELQTFINSSIKDFSVLGKRVLEDAEKMKQVQIDRRIAAELCGKMFVEQEIINTVQLNILKKEIYDPSYPDFQEMNLWSFYNWTTHALKSSHPTEYMERHNKLHDYVTAEYL